MRRSCIPAQSVQAKSCAKLRTKPLKQHYGHIAGVKVKATFSKDHKFRYRLEVTLQSAAMNGKTACVIMQNPSYASEDVADKSVQFMERIIFLRNLREFAGVRKMIVVNQYARIQTNNFRDDASHIGVKNDAAIRRAIKESDIVIVAWGSSNKFEERKDFIRREFQRNKGKLLLKTKSHPARAGYAGFILSYP